MIPVDWKSLFEPALTTAGVAGHATALRNTHRLRIEWGDCDPAGIIFYPRYFEIFAASTAALFERALGTTMIRYLKTFDFAGYPLVRVQHEHAFSHLVDHSCARQREGVEHTIVEQRVGVEG